MSRPRVRRSSTFLLTVRLRSRTFWASWHQRSLTRRLQRAERRSLLLRLSLDSSLLREKELSQLLLQQQHRLSEMADSRSFHSQPSTPEQEILLPPPEQPTHLERLLSTTPE